MTKFTDHLWQDLAREHGQTLAYTDRSEPGRARRPRPRILAGGSLGLAGIAAALVLILGAGGASAPPAFAVTTHHDGSVWVKINRQSGVVGANRRLATMGIHERLFTVYGNVSHSSTKSITSVSGRGYVNVSLPQSCLKDVQKGGIVHVIFPSKAAQEQAVGSGTYTAPSPVANTGGDPNNDTFVVVACPSIMTGASTVSGTGSSGAGNSGTGNSGTVATGQGIGGTGDSGSAAAGTGNS